jgi:hypothetical protein
MTEWLDRSLTVRCTTAGSQKPFRCASQTSSTFSDAEEDDEELLALRRQRAGTSADLLLRAPADKALRARPSAGAPQLSADSSRRAQHDAC